MDLTAFAEEVGSDDPVSCVGGRTQWEVGGPVDPAAREVKAPGGIVELEPEEMTVRCGAGTVVAELQAALGERGQMVILPDRPGATVGGLLAVGRSGVLRLGHGAMRDCLLQARVVDGGGEIVKAGGPTVKNVTGYDLCRLLVGSLGTLAFLGEVILRSRPRPEVRRWFAGEVDPFALHQRLYRPASILWDATTTWLCLEGHPDDVAAESAVAGGGLTEVEGPPPLPSGGRASLRPAALAELRGDFVAEVGVGVVHLAEPWSPPVPDDASLAIHRRLKASFDPTGRLNPGRSPYRVAMK